MQKRRGIAWGSIKNVKQDAGRNHCPENIGCILGDPFRIITDHPFHAAPGADCPSDPALFGRKKFCRIDDPANTFMRVTSDCRLPRPVSEGRGKPPRSDKAPGDRLPGAAHVDELDLALPWWRTFFS